MTASVEAIERFSDRREIRPDTGAEHHRCRGVPGWYRSSALVAKNYRDECQRLQCADVQSHPVGCEGQYGYAKRAAPNSHNTPAVVRLPIPPRLGQVTAVHCQSSTTWPEKIAGESYEDHQHGRQDRMASHDRPITRKSTCQRLLVMEFSV